MKPLSFALFYFFLSFRHTLGFSPTYLTCQLEKPDEVSALHGCPDGTIYVSSTDNSAQFSSVQQAIESIPETGSAVILIGKGQYNEMINVTRSAPLTLLGQLDSETISASTGNASQLNSVKIWNSQCAHDGVTDEETATLTVAPSIDHPFGSTDFRVYNIDFENRGCDTISQALVTSFTLVNASLYGCTLASWQDTFYTGWEANTFIVDTTVYGQTDYIFGCGRTWFQSVTLANRGCGGGITAWDGSPDTTNGIYIANSSIIRSPDLDDSVVTDQKCYLGRPWSEYAVAVFLDTYMDNSINPAGFIAWDGSSKISETVYDAEYGSYGPGGDTSHRVKQDHILDSVQAERFTIDYVFGEHPKWIDFTYEY